MAVPTLTPRSSTSTIVLPSTGSASDVNTYVPYGIYSAPATTMYSSDFVSGAVDQVAFTYMKLGGNILDIELTPGNVYASYEEAVLEYSYLLNIHQAENIISNVLGGATGSFDQDGTLKSGALSSSLAGTHINLKFPRFDYANAKRVSDMVASEIGVGGSITEYSASFTVSSGVQDYDLQSIISASAATDSTVDYYGLVSNKRISIKKVFYRTPRSSWRFYGYYGGLNVIGNYSNYGQYADSTTYEVIPTWYNKLQAMAYADAIYTRNSHYTFEIKNNKLRLFPTPQVSSPDKYWIQFTIASDSWVTGSSDDGIDGINNINTIPFGNVPYNNINGIGKNWIRNYALALSKEVLGNIRSKFGSIPIPGNDVTLNGDALLAQAKEEQKELKEELSSIFEKTTAAKLAEIEATLAENSKKTLSVFPNMIYRF